ncbi:hypothetical protein HYPGJ_31570 [Hyphomicrobium sp. GJ21]|nr:hypothetical protein HYPGJ_31570 [Hyphomicrobium sp. GJ21]
MTRDVTYPEEISISTVNISRGNMPAASHPLCIFEKMAEYRHFWRLLATFNVTCVATTAFA